MNQDTLNQIFSLLQQGNEDINNKFTDLQNHIDYLTEENRVLRNQSEDLKQRIKTTLQDLIDKL